MNLPPFLRASVAPQWVEIGALEAGQVLTVAEPADAERLRADKERLYELEKGMSAHRLSWIKGGVALRQIAEEGVWRAIYGTFDEYVDRRWGISPRKAYDLIRAARVAESVREAAGLPPGKHNHALSLRAALVLAKLSRKDWDEARTRREQAECLKEAIAGSGTKSPTAQYLRAAVAARMGSPTRQRRKKKEQPRRVLLNEGTATLCGKRLTIVTKTKDADLVALLRELVAKLIDASGVSTPPARPKT